MNMKDRIDEIMARRKTRLESRQQDEETPVEVSQIPGGGGFVVPEEPEAEEELEAEDDDEGMTFQSPIDPL